MDPISPVKSQDPSWRFDQLLAVLTEKDADEKQIVSAANDICILFQSSPTFRAEIVTRLFLYKISFMFAHNLSLIRALAFRLARYTIYSLDLLVTIVRAKLLVQIIIALSRPLALETERKQALKLVRAFLHVPNGANCISIGVVKLLVALIEHQAAPDDGTPILSPVPLPGPIPDAVKDVYRETLCEFAIAKPELVYHAGGFAVLFDAMVNESASIPTAISCLLVILHLVSSPKSRKFFRDGYDMSLVLRVFALVEDDSLSADDVGGGGGTLAKVGASHTKISTAQLHKSALLVSIILKHFVGLMCFSTENFAMLTHLVQNLAKRNVRLRECIMHLILDVLLLSPFPFWKDNEFSEKLHHYRASRAPYNISQVSTKPQSPWVTRITKHYQGLLTLLLLKVDVLHYLNAIINENLNTANVRQAQALATRVYGLAHTLLPPELLAMLEEQVPVLASPFDNNCIESIDTLKGKACLNTCTTKHLRQAVRTITNRARYSIDDAEFKLQLFNTRVLTTKDFTDWNWPLMLNLIHGPLRHPRRFAETLDRSPKFFKRLMLFYRPFKFRFCNIPHTAESSAIYVLVGCQLLDLMLQLEQGIRYLLSNKLLPQIAEIFAQIDPYSGITADEPILSPSRIDRNIGLGYVRFVGVLSNTSAGMALLEQWQIPSILSNIVDSSADSGDYDLVLAELLKAVDFAQDSAFRLLLQKICWVSNARIRAFVVRRIIPSILENSECEFFIIKLLVQLLYDPDPDFARRVVECLALHCAATDYKSIPFFISLRPSILILRRTRRGRDLLVRFMVDPAGFKYLHESGFVDDEFSAWTNMDDYTFLHKIESLLLRQCFQYFDQNLDQDPDPEDRFRMDFFQNLLSTEEGLHYLAGFEQQKFLTNLMSTIEVASKSVADIDFSDASTYDENLSLFQRLKQSLWIIGCIASAPYGVALLDPYKNTGQSFPVIATVLNLLASCAEWQVRGVCFFMAGLISSTNDGCEILDELGWTSVFDEYGCSKGLAYPHKYYPLFNTSARGTCDSSNSAFRSFAKWQLSEGNNLFGPFVGQSGIYGGDTEEEEDYDGDENEDDYNDEEAYIGERGLDKSRARIIRLIEHLNSVISRVERKAIRELLKFKRTRPELFGSAKLLLQVVALVDRLHYGYQLRQFIFGLFLETSALDNLAKLDKPRGRAPSDVDISAVISAN